jgi:hypothetical protein
MKKSSALKRCAAHGSGMECEAEITYNKGRQAVVRMLGKSVIAIGELISWTRTSNSGLRGRRTQLFDIRT